MVQQAQNAPNNTPCKQPPTPPSYPHSSNVRHAGCQWGTRNQEGIPRRGQATRCALDALHNLTTSHHNPHIQSTACHITVQPRPHNTRPCHQHHRHTKVSHHHASQMTQHHQPQKWAHQCQHHTTGLGNRHASTNTQPPTAPARPSPPRATAHNSHACPSTPQWHQPLNPPTQHGTTAPPLPNPGTQLLGHSCPHTTLYPAA
jgi:hypothetical protein